jgi:hypothetical protein
MNDYLKSEPTLNLSDHGVHFTGSDLLDSVMIFEFTRFFSGF